MINSKDIEAEFGFNPDKLREKYLEERDRRIRADGADQYVDLKEDFAERGTDPFVDAEIDREPVEKNVEALILGGGIAGLLSGVSLLEEGIDDFLIIEQAGDFGGTWYWNRYPGIRCDIEAYVYMPLLEEVGTIPSQKYAHGSEIQRHLSMLGHKFGLYEHALFQTVIKSVRWLDNENRWEVRTQRDDRILARHVMLSNAPLHKPKLPGIPGLDSFKGKSFHTSRWDFEYTGGDSHGNLNGLKGKRVALIGTGATGIQVMPHVAEAADHLYVFQRTPSAVDKRNNRPTDVNWFKSQPSGWQQRRTDNFVSMILGIEDGEDLVNDCWTSNIKIFKSLSASDNPVLNEASPEQLAQIADYIKMEQLRAMCDELIDDPETAEALKPWYNYLCKRPLFSDEYHATFNRNNVTLVDTKGKGVERVTDDALFVGGKEYPVDCIIFATGFRVAVYSHKAGGYELTGRNGASVDEKWAKGQRTVHGLKASGFPNFHIIGTYAQAAQSFNYTHVTRSQTQHAAKIIAKCRDEGVTTFEVTEEAESNWLRALNEGSDRSKFEAECTPGYFNNEGKSEDEPTLLSNMYGGGPFEYIKLLDKWLEEGFDAETVRT